MLEITKATEITTVARMKQKKALLNKGRTSYTGITGVWSGETLFLSTQIENVDLGLRFGLCTWRFDLCSLVEELQIIIGLIIKDQRPKYKDQSPYFLFLKASFRSVCLLVNATGRPSINR